MSAGKAPKTLSLTQLAWQMCWEQVTSQVSVWVFVIERDANDEVRQCTDILTRIQLENVRENTFVGTPLRAFELLLEDYLRSEIHRGR